MPNSETTLLVWYCRACRKSYKVQPPAEEPACRCTTPIPGLSPTEVTMLATPKTRPLQVITDEDARLRALARKGTRVRVTFEAEVSDAWLWGTEGQPKKLELFVTTPDGHRHTIDPQMEGVHVEAMTEDAE